jgi:hypothetical protein
VEAKCNLKNSLNLMCPVFNFGNKVHKNSNFYPNFSKIMLALARPTIKIIFGKWTRLGREIQITITSLMW